MKVFLSPSNQDGNKYAYGNTNEMEQCGKIAYSCKSALERNGIDVMLMHSEDMGTKVTRSNAWGADFYIPIHSNAYNGAVSGTRMFYYSEGGEGHKMSKCIFNRLSPITPGTSDNIQQSTGLYETRMPNAYTAYIEVDFHDVPSVAKWIIEHTSEIGEAIAHGVCDYAGIQYKGPETATEKEQTVSDTLYRVQVGAFRVKGNAEAMLTKIKAAGFTDAFIKEG